MKLVLLFAAAVASIAFVAGIKRNSQDHSDNQGGRLLVRSGHNKPNAH